MARTPKITNEEILAAAQQIFLEQGERASTLEIANKAGISEASIFKRFATKQALFLAAMGINETPRWVKDLPHRQPTPNIKIELIELCREMMALYQQVLPRVLMVMAQSNSPFPPLIPPPPIRDTRLLTGFLEKSIDQSYIQSNSASTIAQLIVGAIVNYVITTTISQSIVIPSPLSQPIDPDIFVENLIENLWTGIAPHQSGHQQN
jgi:AcrR family transcriptional regulator